MTTLKTNKKMTSSQRFLTMKLVTGRQLASELGEEER